MRLGFDAKRLYSNFTGLGNYSRTLLWNLQLHHPDHEYQLYTPAFHRNSTTKGFEQHDGFSTVEFNGTFSSFWRSFSLAGQLERDQIEVYHGLSNEIPFPLGSSSIKSVVTIHDLIFKALPKTYPWFDRKMYDLKFRKSCEQADRIVAISEYTKRDIIRYYQIDPMKIEVIYQACSASFYTETISKATKKALETYQLPKDFLLYVGSIVERKNLKGILYAFARQESNKRIPLVIVGNGPSSYRKELNALIQQHQLQKNLIWITDLKDNQVLQALYQNAQALIYPSFYEGFGLPVVEALLSKTPVITSKASALPEAGGPNSWYVNPKEPDEILEAIEKVLHDSTLRQNMMRSGYLFARKQFDPKRLSDQLMGLYTAR